MAKITVVGSGASGIHFALSALKKGHQVTMLDVGYSPPASVNPDDTYAELKEKLADPVVYFLGKNFESVIPPDFDQEIYEFPPHKMVIFKIVPGFRYHSTGFDPLFSFARGGLAEAWTGGCYPFSEKDLEHFPFDFNEIKPYYEEVARRIGVIGDDDDLAAFFPLHKYLLPPLELDEHSKLLYDHYEKNRARFQKKMGVFMGRSRIATLSQAQGDRKACDYSGRCLWGCPTDSLYVPSLTLKECLTYDNFQYLPGVLVRYFKYDSRNRITKVVVDYIDENSTGELAVDNLVLGAGTLSSTKIFLDSIYRHSGEIVKLGGLMDNRQVLVPFINLKMVGKNYNPDTYQYHQLAIGFESDDGDQYIHGQITTVKTALMHPAIQQIPLDLKMATFLTRNLHAALGVININFCDYRREENVVSIEPDHDSPDTQNTKLKIVYQPASEEKENIKAAMKKVKRFLRKLGVVVPPGMAHIRPMGASVHYSGTIPMTVEPQQRSVTPQGQCRDFENLFFVDGTSFSFLPAKNLTFTLMANAARVADKNFG
jgi:choline dehydrogenase-like flavoprotein